MPAPLSRSVVSNIQKFSRDAPFVFLGRVESEPSLVRVERIYQAPDVLRDFVDQEVSILAASSPAPRSHPSAVFFTVPVSFGEVVGLKEIGSVPEPDDLDAVADVIAKVSAEMSDEALREHLKEADAVVHAKVVETRASPTSSTEPLSEHSPEWRIATLQVESTLKGAAHGVIKVRYPSSTDVRWYAVPKPAAGEDALFILHRDGSRLGGAELAILHPMDVVQSTPHELERHRRHL